MRRNPLRRWLLLVGLGPGLFVSPTRPGQEPAPQLLAPEGFEVTIYAEGLDRPWGLAFGPDDRLYVAELGAGRVVRLVDRDEDGRADSVATLIAGLDRPSGLAWDGGDALIAEPGRVIHLSGAAGSAPVLTTVLDGVPADSPWIRAILPVATRSAFFISVGATCDFCQETDHRRGAILRVSAGAGAEEVWAQGLRNVGGLALHPDTGELWATVADRDGLGDELPAGELNVIRRGAHYGWPFCYGARLPSPEFADRSRCDTTEPPVLAFPAHSTPLGLVFYTGQAFPTAYRGDAFVALYGSGSRSRPVGYKLARLRVEGGRPVALEDFLTGWIGPGGRVYGRPVQPLVGPDGAVYVSDDYGGRIWRVSYAVDQP